MLALKKWDCLGFKVRDNLSARTKYLRAQLAGLPAAPPSPATGQGAGAQGTGDRGTGGQPGGASGASKRLPSVEEAWNLQTNSENPSRQQPNGGRNPKDPKAPPHPHQQQVNTKPFGDTISNTNVGVVYEVQSNLRTP